MSLTWTEATRLAAKGGPADRLRRGLIIVCAALGAMLLAAAATIPSYWPGDGSRPESSSVLGRLLADRDLAVGVMIAMVLLAVPVLHLMVQAVRIGAPERDRRLAAMRCAGATAADVRSVLRAEALVCSLVGTVIGVPVFFALLVLAPRTLRVEYVDTLPGASVDSGTLPVLAAAGGPHPLLLVLAVALGPLLAAALVPRAARRVRVTVVEQSTQERRAGRVLPTTFLVCVVLTVLSLLAVVASLNEQPRWYGPIVDALVALLPLTAVGLTLTTLLLSAAPVAVRLGRWLSGRPGPTALIAGRMMLARPRLAATTAVSLVLVALVGSVAIGVEGVLRAELVNGAQDNGVLREADVAAGRLPRDLLFYTVPMTVSQVLALVAAILGAVGLLVAVTEQVSLRGPQLRRQIAAGVPRRVLRRALVLEAVAPVAAMTTLALALGVVLIAVGGWLLGQGGAPITISGIRWERYLVLWAVLIGCSVIAAHVGGRGLTDTGARG